MITSEQLRDAFKYLFPDELPALKRYAQMLPDNPVVVNIGSGAGTSGLAFLETLRERGIGVDIGTIYTIDIQEDDSPLGCLYAERRAVEDAGLGIHLQGVHPKLEQFPGDSKEWGRVWRGDYGEEEAPRFPSPDLVFIDGDHSYEGCKGDIDAWIPNLKPGGYLLIHDYNKAEVIAEMEYDPDTMPHYKEWVGVNQAVDELMDSQHVDFVEVVDTLAVFRKKLLPTQPESGL